MNYDLYSTKLISPQAHQETGYSRSLRNHYPYLTSPFQTANNPVLYSHVSQPLQNNPIPTNLLHRGKWRSGLKALNSNSKTTTKKLAEKRAQRCFKKSNRSVEAIRVPTEVLSPRVVRARV